MDTRRRIWIVGIVAAAALATAAGIGIAATSGDDQPLTGTDGDRAAQAALDHLGGGTVVETEAGDGGAAYEVEVRLPDGSQVEVQLDASFAVIGSGSDDDGGAEGTDDDGGVDDGGADDGAGGDD